MSVVKRIEKLTYIDFQDPSTRYFHRCFPNFCECLMSTAVRSESKRYVVKVVLIDRLQEHHDGSLHNLVFKGRNTNRTCFALCSLRNMRPFDGRGFVRSRFHAFEKILQIFMKIFCILLARHIVDSGGTIFSSSMV